MRDDTSTSTVGAERGALLRSYKLRVEVVRGPTAGQVVELAGPVARIGSGKACDFVLRDPTVSRSHLVLRIEDNSIRVLDTGSRNGTTVDGVRIRDAYARPDSSIGLGQSTICLRMLREVIELPLFSGEEFGLLIGRSVSMRRLFALLERVSPTDTTVLIEGETGTGKELVAAAVHHASARRRRPFIVFDCSSVSPALIESELFGHERGAFTGALRERIGCFEAAHNGTLFLDEIGELPLELQSKLLRAIETRAVVRVGSNTPRPADVRIIAATNRSLANEVERGRFREDLYYRLAVVPVHLPPLRERLDDIPLLVRHFEAAWRARESPPPPLSDEVIRRFSFHSWPGNVRELRNKVDMMLALGLRDLPCTDPEPPVKLPLDALEVNLREPLHLWLSKIEDAYRRASQERALQASDNNVSRAAQMAGVGRAFVQRMMRRYGLRREDEAA